MCNHMVSFAFCWYHGRLVLVPYSILSTTLSDTTLSSSILPRSTTHHPIAPRHIPPHFTLHLPCLTYPSPIHSISLPRAMQSHKHQLTFEISLGRSYGYQVTTLGPHKPIVLYSTQFYHPLSAIGQIRSSKYLMQHFSDRLDDRVWAYVRFSLVSCLYFTRAK